MIDNAAEGALAGATAALRNALPASGGSRLPRLVALLQEKTKAKIAEEKSEYRRNCSAAMLKLGTEVGRRGVFWGGGWAAGGDTHDHTCHSCKTNDLASLPSPDGERRVFAGPCSFSGGAGEVLMFRLCESFSH